MELEFALTGTANGTPLEAVGGGVLDPGHCELWLESQRSPLRWDPTLALLAIFDIARVAGPHASELPIAGDCHLFVYDDQERDMGSLHATSLVLFGADTVHVRLQIEDARVRFEVGEQLVRVGPPVIGSEVALGPRSTVVTGAWSIGSSRGSEYQAVSTTVVEWPAVRPPARPSARFGSAKLTAREGRIELSLS